MTPVQINKALTKSGTGLPNRKFDQALYKNNIIQYYT